ncbi:hypothetical protein [Alicyclobacillus acidoterrestris]|uniref:Uncharacterized protein n=1 Tax=Alicyclobacillus acidoterrestris (strain ATCC 49025 / DSM 3922 / CIP 106132 / NCIMB 13137 / GD3B) TaxID=1356854 RepID=T0BYD1_ALIAG|nr:hypothetical protein [Alicyclobacillus acidoterrestris]EPZ45410.1 hypothetical protein N007_09050 [Alicyclobacillus acidoterrestris ATCC 49025]UNO48438.1 hypothetical protein K1I37_17505 [Alicyclobacillus acidoterrestris]
MEEKLDQILAILSDHTAKLEENTNILNAVRHSMEVTTAKIEAIDRRLDTIEGRLVRIERN